MSLADACILKGWLMRDRRATPEIMAAIEAVILALSEPRDQISILPVECVIPTKAEVAREDPPAPKRRGWSDESKAAAAERMRARLAAKREAKTSLFARVAPRTSSPTSSDDSPPWIDAKGRPSTDQDRSPTKVAEACEGTSRLPSAITVPIRPDPWETAELSPADWPDIQKLLAAGATRGKIAGDYDVPVPTLDAFIERQMESARMRRAAKESPPGEAVAPLP